MPDGERHALAVAQGFVRNQGDAWTWTLDLLTRGLADLTAGTEAAQATEAEQHEDYDAIAALLGRRLARCTRCWRETPTSPRSPGTPPGTMSQRMGRAGAAAAGRGLRRAWRAGQTAGTVPPTRPCRRAGGERESLAAEVRSLASSARGAMLTRIHGDLHLGQVLVANGDAYIIDFEGEPAKPVDAAAGEEPPAARRRRAAALVRLCGRGDGAQERRHAGACRRPAACRVPRHLRAHARAQCFLAGYRRGAAGRWTATIEQNLLRLFLIEKAAYEIAYEAANRPTWLDVPAARPRATGHAGCRHETSMIDVAAPAARRGGGACQRHARAIRSRARPARDRIGRVVRAFLPGALAVEVLRARRRRRRLAAWRQRPRTGCSSAASPARNPIVLRIAWPGGGAGDRGSLLPSARCSASSTCICSTRAGISSSADAPRRAAR